MRNVKNRLVSETIFHSQSGVKSEVGNSDFSACDDSLKQGRVQTLGCLRGVTEQFLIFSVEGCKAEAL